VVQLTNGAFAPEKSTSSVMAPTFLQPRSVNNWRLMMARLPSRRALRSWPTVGRELGLSGSLLTPDRSEVAGGDPRGGPLLSYSLKLERIAVWFRQGEGLFPGAH
jgi:hypothetical protein